MRTGIKLLLLLSIFISANEQANSALCKDIFRRQTSTTISTISPKQAWNLAIIKGNMLYPQMNAGINLYALAQYIKRPVVPFSDLMSKLENNDIESLIKAMNKAHATYNVSVSEPGPHHFQAAFTPGKSWFVRHNNLIKNALSTNLMAIIYAIDQRALAKGNYDHKGVDILFTDTAHNQSRQLLERIGLHIENALTHPPIVEKARQRRDVLRDPALPNQKQFLWDTSKELAQMLRQQIETNITQDTQIPKTIQNFMKKFLDEYIPWQ